MPIAGGALDPQLERYAASRATSEGAASYDSKYERELHKRISDRVERRVIARALALAPGPHERILDVPCGAGRLSPELVLHSRGRIVEADYSPTMLERCRSNARGYEPAVARVNALQLPFRDGSFDLVFSARISHHIGLESDRERWLRELCRVSRRYVVATFFDASSLKNLIRIARSPFSRKRPKNTMRLARVHELAQESGFVVKAAIPLSRLFSGHRYLVLERR
jgi:ubiquinone/menaquinone biosynthesis C-methylase UbiE